MSNFKRPWMCIAALLVGSSTFEASMSAAEPQMMTKQQAEALLASGKFHHVKSKSEIPKLWWKAMTLDGLSDIGGPFSAGCTGTEPHRRLMAAAVSEPYAVTVTEQGGIAYMTDIRIFKREKDSVSSVYYESLHDPRLHEVLKKLGQ
ncbi:MAG TPA: hypothetical protein V6D22_14025 [Candidatus Obscuribacterales bacterium]